MCPDFEPVAPVVSRIDVAKQERGEGGWRNGKVSGCHFFLYGLLINLLLICSSFVIPTENRTKLMELSNLSNMDKTPHCR